MRLAADLRAHVENVGTDRVGRLAASSFASGAGWLLAKISERAYARGTFEIEELQELANACQELSHFEPDPAPTLKVLPKEAPHG